MVAHELRTPLTTLIVGSRILLGDTRKARRREVARDVAVEAQRLADAVEDLLVLVDLEAPPADREPVSLQATVRAAIERASRLAPDLSIRTLLAADAPPVVADGGAVTHLVRNLVAAAVDGAGESGLLEVALLGAPGGGVAIRLAGRPDRRATSAPRATPRLRDVATHLIADRLGGRLEIATGRGVVRADLLLPARGDASGAPGGDDDRGEIPRAEDSTVGPA